MSVLDDPRTIVRIAVTAIVPTDALEGNHRAEALAWIDSGAPLFRVAKPDQPPQHLVSYFVLVDTARRKLLLVDHIKSGLWLPAGGHVEPYEDPRTTVKRESLEELSKPASFATYVGGNPIFITTTITVDRGHTDVSLWYVLVGDSEEPLDYDTREFRGIMWLSIEEVLGTDVSKLDPHMHRFVRKLQTLIPV